MKPLKYIMDNEFKMIVLSNKIDIINYLDIESFDDEKIVVKHESGITSIYGEELTISKLLDREMLISGEIDRIEFR